MEKPDIKFKVVTPERTVFEESVYSVTMPTKSGQVTVLPSHRPYVAALCPGEIMLRMPGGEAGEEIFMAISGGFVEFNKNKMVVLADTCERAEEIDIKKAEEAKAKAEELKKQRISTNEMEYATAAAHLEKHLTRIKVAKKYMRKKGMRMK